MVQRASYIHRIKKRKKRKGQHAKSKTSFNKGSDNYIKRKIGQGK